MKNFYSTLFLLIICFQGVVKLQTTSQMDIVGSAEFLPNELISNNIRDTNGEICAGIMIVSDLEGLTYQSNNGIVDNQSKPGKDLLYVSPTERVLEVYKFGFEPLRIILSELSINLSSGKVWQIKITGEKKLDLIPINILTDPTDVNIYIDGKLQGKGKTFQVSSGEHIIKIEKDGYKKIEDSVSVSSSNNLFNYKLNKVNLVLVTIKSEPKGAKIYLENSEKGITNEQIFEYPGTYKIKLIKSGYLTLEETITVGEGNENNFNYRLNKNTATVSFNVIPLDAEIRIDTELQTSKVVNLLPGLHNIEITKDGYLSQSDKIEVKLGEIINKDYKLEKNSVSISLNVVPNDAKVLFNKKDYSNKKLIDISPGRYLVEISREGYSSIEEILNLELNNPINKNYTLEKRVGTLQLKIKPIDAKVKLLMNGKIINSWSGSKMVNDLMIGNYQLRAEADGYEQINYELTIEENKTTVKETNMVIKTNNSYQEIQRQNKLTGNITDEQFSRSSAFLQSALIPGLGQITNSKSRGWLYTIGSIAAGVYYYINVTEHNDNIAKYDELVQNYLFEKTSTNRLAASEAYDKADKSLSTTYVAMGILVAIYAVNLVDVLTFESPQNSIISKTEIHPALLKVQNNQYAFGINVRYSL